MGRSETQMPVWQLQARIRRQAAEATHIDVHEHVLEQFPMPGAADAIENHSRKVDAWILIPESPHQSSERAGLTAGIHHQNNRKSELQGHVGRTALRARSNAVEQPHHALHEGHVTTTAVAIEAELNPVFATKRQIKISAGSSRSQ